jgi:hypothetical protein
MKTVTIFISSSRSKMATAMSILILLFVSTSAKAITVYDCEDRNVTVQTIDLLQTSDCPEGETDYDDPVETTVQILQRSSDINHVAFQCHVSVTKTVASCGWDSITYGIMTTEWNRVLEISPKQCREAVSNNTLTIEGKTYNVVPGEILQNTFFSHGMVYKDGTCDVDTFTSGGMVFKSHFEETKIRIYIKKVKASVNLDDGKISFPGGLTTNFKDKVVQDALEGTIVWTANDPPCEDTVSQVCITLFKTLCS